MQTGDQWVFLLKRHAHCCPFVGNQNSFSETLPAHTPNTCQRALVNPSLQPRCSHLLYKLSSRVLNLRTSQGCLVLADCGSYLEYSNQTIPNSILISVSQETTLGRKNKSKTSQFKATWGLGDNSSSHSSQICLPSGFTVHSVQLIVPVSAGLEDSKGTFYRVWGSWSPGCIIYNQPVFPLSVWFVKFQSHTKGPLFFFFFP